MKIPVIRLRLTLKTWILSIFYRYILPRMDFTRRVGSIFLELRTHVIVLQEETNHNSMV